MPDEQENRPVSAPETPTDTTDRVLLKETVNIVAPEATEKDEKSVKAEGKTSKSHKWVDKFIGSVIADRYEIISSIGAGATTSVYKALDKVKTGPSEELKQFVAVKILRNEFSSSEFTVRRFEQECKMLKLLAHHNIVAYRDEGVTDSDQPFMVMEYLEGSSLKQLIESGGGVDAKRAVGIFIQVCAALASAHQKSVVHRDLKPANIMVTKSFANKDVEDVVKILDFGVSKLLPIQGETFQTRTQTGEMLGTLLYMSPEQCLDQDLDGRSDIYSFGCVMYETLTGTPPITARTAFETMNKHMTHRPEKLSAVRPDIYWPEQLDEILRKAMEKSPAFRYPTATALQVELIEYQRGRDTVRVIEQVLGAKPTTTTTTTINPTTSSPRLNAQNENSDLSTDDKMGPTATEILAPVLIGAIPIMAIGMLVLASLGQMVFAIMFVMAVLGVVGGIILIDLARAH